MSTSHDCNPAAAVIERLGGTAAVAAVLGRDESTIRRWRMPRPSGTDGNIPHDAAIALIQHAEANGLALSWDDFKPAALADTG